MLYKYNLNNFNKLLTPKTLLWRILKRIFNYLIIRIHNFPQIVWIKNVIKALPSAERNVCFIPFISRVCDMYFNWWFTDQYKTD